ncbi:DUF1963 domain-containing protein [Streptomyces sp. NPDC047022]|uniref:DUF1963 domain-containing protein n=1 Tax=Streptomyces sp. NPDC047022 TaxID=3155737 RepID=UPI00340DA7A0
MTPELLRRLAPFRAEALKRGIPPEDVDRWIAIARPSGTLVTSGDGRVVGRFGGPLMLPVDAHDPRFPLLATLDCASLPAEVTGLPLPPDGHLLLFGFPDLMDPDSADSAGEVVYIPAGTPVEERKTRNAVVHGKEIDEDDEYLALYEQFPDDELRLSADVSLPYHYLSTSPEVPRSAQLPGHPHWEELADAWNDISYSIVIDGPLRIGGYASHECTESDPVTDAAKDAVRAVRAQDPGAAAKLPAPEEWVLLAQWDIDLDEREGSTLHWVIPRQDLAERRFDRVHVSFFWNP